MSLRTLLFDLDGTLLPMDVDVFMKGYFGALLPSIAHVVDPARIVDQIWNATRDVIRDENAALTNMEVFQRSFLAATAMQKEDIWPLFDTFYENTFGGLEFLAQPTAISREICRTALDKGYQLVIATNPIFPEVAIRHRLTWAGLGDLPFSLITTMEDMHYCKPNPKYFVEILDKLDVSPSDCMMFGNDVQEDGVAGKIGMQTFLVTDHAIDRGVGHVDFTHEGTLADVLTFVQQLPSL